MYLRFNTLHSLDSDFQRLGNQVISNDPRLVSAAHGGQILALDAIPLNGSNVISSPAPPTGLFYNSYNQIMNGQILYYAGDQNKPFPQPLFSSDVKTISTIYTDPMGVCKPSFELEQKMDDCLDRSCSDESCLLWVKDTQMQRDDILSRQMARQNQSKFII